MCYLQVILQEYELFSHTKDSSMGSHEHKKTYLLCLCHTHTYDTVKYFIIS